jgi:hypothetical protein
MASPEECTRLRLTQRRNTSSGMVAVLYFIHPKL